MLVNWFLCFITILLTDKTAAIQLPLFLKLHNYTDDLAPISPRYNPCDNFYEYACNTWTSRIKKPSYEPVWNPWIAASHEIKRRLSKILSRHDPHLVKPQIFYRSCLRIVNHEDQYLGELKLLVSNFGGWPLIDKTWKDENFDWLRYLSKITQVLGIHPMLKIHADLDYKDPAQFTIYLEAGNLIFPQYVLTDSTRNIELEAYEKWILETAAHIYDNITSFDDDRIKEIVKFEMHLARIMDVKGRTERMTVKSLTKKIFGDWLGALKSIFGGSIEITSNTTVVVKNYSFLKKIFLLVDRVGNRSVADYLIWTVIKEMSRDTTQHLRNLNFLIDRAILGVQDDLSREHECLDKVVSYFHPLLIRPYLKLYVNPQIFPKISSMVDSIKTEFINILMKSDWLSQEAKLLSAKKVKNIRMQLVYPSEMFNEQSRESLYSKVQMTRDHFLNIIKLKKLKSRQVLQRLTEKRPTVLWPSTPFDVNAYYSILQNSIFIPLGLLEPPFFQYNGEDIINYGALGSLIGHEISHSLDTAGILADSNGKVGKWWPENDVALYKQHIHCFGAGSIIGENIADHNGVRISLGALKSLHSHSRLNKFFISFAQMWCEVSEDTDIFTGGEHAPVLHRVENLNNNGDFRETFKCGLDNSCMLW